MIQGSGTTQPVDDTRTAPRQAAIRWVGSHLEVIEAAAAIPVAAALFVIYHHLTATREFNSDAAFMPLQAYDVLHGNLAGGWIGPSETRLFTLLPAYVVAVAVRGLSPTVVHFVSAGYYTLIAITIAALARAGLSRRDQPLAMLLALGLAAAPAYPAGVMTLLPAGPGHLSTAAFMLLAVLCLHVSHRRARIPLTLIAGILLSLNIASDPAALYVGAVPIALVHGLRLASRLPHGVLDDGVDLGVVLVSILLGVLGGEAFYAAIGYHLYPVPTAFVPLSAIPGQIGITLNGWLNMFGAFFLDQSLSPVTTGWQLLRLAGYAFTVAACGVVAVQTVRAVRRRGPRRAGDPLVLSQVLLAIVIVNVAAVILSTNTPVDANGRYLIPGVFAGAALAGRAGPAMLSRFRWKAVAAAVCVCYLATLPLSLRYPAAPVPDYGVAAWLQAHHLKHGLAGYWSASDITVVSGNSVKVRAVTDKPGTLGPTYWVVNRGWYGPHAFANFVLIDNHNSNVTPAVAVHTFGPPNRVRRVNGVTVMVWNHNLIPDLGPPSKF